KDRQLPQADEIQALSNKHPKHKRAQSKRGQEGPSDAARRQIQKRSKKTGLQDPAGDGPDVAHGSRDGIGSNGSTPDIPRTPVIEPGSSLPPCLLLGPLKAS